MPKRSKANHHDKKTIACGRGADCIRPDCPFQHPESWNVDASIRQARQQRRNDLLELHERQEQQINRLCQRGDLCTKLSCPYRHSPAWDPVKNQRLAEEHRRQNEARQERERQHALTVTGEDAKKRGKNTVENDYTYDDEYFDVYEKVWEKQNQRQLGH